MSPIDYTYSSVVQNTSQTITNDFDPINTSAIKYCEGVDNSLNLNKAIVGETMNFSTSDLIGWSLQIARGMQYLASKKVDVYLFKIF